MAKKVVTMGELMLRLSPPNYLRFVQTDSFEAVFGGGEANVAVSLANYGLDSYYVTKLPSTILARLRSTVCGAMVSKRTILLEVAIASGSIMLKPVRR